MARRLSKTEIISFSERSNVPKHGPNSERIADDVRTLHRLGYAQELLRRMSGFSNFAISLSTICILSGGIASFHVGFCSVGGASIGLGWPLASLFALCVAATMGQVASAFPTAGSLYHWASILGGHGWGWATAWFNLAGLVIIVAAINVGMFQFLLGPLAPLVQYDPSASETAHYFIQLTALLLITFSQALFNHLGIRVTAWLIDFSGYWILAVSLALTAALFAYAPAHDWSRLVTFSNFSGLPSGEPVWPPTENPVWLFALGLLLPAYTITGFDASAHTSEETIGAAHHVPRGIVRSVIVSGLFGWFMLAAAVLAIPNMEETARQGANAFSYIMDEVLPFPPRLALYLGIAVAQYLCGLATVTSASRMAYAFARDGGLPYSHLWRQISAVYVTPVYAIWLVAAAAVLFTLYAPVYLTLTAVSTIFLYISYILPTVLGCIAYGRTWKTMGPWQLGPLYRPLALVCVLGGGLLVAIGMAPPNEKAMFVVGGAFMVLSAVWFGGERKRFLGPPRTVLEDEMMKGKEWLQTPKE
jgi:amino acid transporter